MIHFRTSWLSLSAAITAALASFSVHGACIEGRVVDAHGRPVPQATVGATAQSPDSADGQAVARHFMRADDDGAFKFTALARVPYVLTATSSGQGAAVSKPVEAGEQACTVAVLAAAPSGLAVSGRVSVPADPQAVDTAVVFSPLSSGGDVRFYALAVDGAYQVELAAGEYGTGSIGVHLRSATRVLTVAQPKTAADFVLHRDSPADEPLRRRLLTLREADQAVRALVTGADDARALARMAVVDHANAAAVEAILSHDGWPTVDQVGYDGVEATWLLVQHGSPATIKRWLPAMKQSADAGELSMSSWALSVDRDRIDDGLAQIYGSQALPVEGHHFAGLRPIEDEAHVDERRARVGLKPLAEYIEELKADYGR